MSLPTRSRKLGGCKGALSLRAQFLVWCLYRHSTYQQQSWGSYFPLANLVVQREGGVALDIRRQDYLCQRGEWGEKSLKRNAFGSGQAYAKLLLSWTRSAPRRRKAFMWDLASKEGWTRQRHFSFFKHTTWKCGWLTAECQAVVSQASLWIPKWWWWGWLTAIVHKYGCMPYYESVQLHHLTSFMKIAFKCCLGSRNELEWF